jgi:polyisoprenoid-binding protein YceI
LDLQTKLFRYLASWEDLMTSPAPTSTLQTRLADGSLAGQWTLDPARSTVALQSKSMWGLAPVKGTFGEVSGDVTITPAGEASGTITIDDASVDTKMKKRDDHLRSADFFETDAYPHITFTASGVSLGDDGATVTGTLLVKDHTKPLAFPATVSAAGDDTFEVDAKVGIDRSEFGLTWSQLRMASMKNTITIHAVFTRGS